MPGISGIDFVIQVNTGTEQNPVWTTVGGRRNATLVLEMEDVDISSADSEDWEEKIPGKRSWSIDFEGLLLLDDTALKALEDSYFQKKLVLVRFQTPSNQVYMGKAKIDELSYEAPYDEEATVTGTLSGATALERVE